ncbi:ATPase [Actinoplanes sp. TBRC 11911]|uniref:ATP-binding protein n=1 Tax=Actinoplanes sp. TBRC 11911 TaxID=2729386 RepID=UPI00145F1A98|nr:LuxR C-terminal-related transcriptional regulator [Actinoplanes sp. TBRC 11911]NMO57571.1 ATPase [Actinoplanes sp. TBRC 11911]
MADISESASAPRAPLAPLSPLSPREAEVLALLGDHLSNAEIGARLFISVRTVESHVSSLLRKLEAPDRRALANRPSRTPSALPAPVTPLVGRVPERAALADTIKLHRQVTAVGPGGVGKTRLALAVAAAVAPEFADGVRFVDLVPITDPAMVGAAVGAAAGIGEQQSRDMDESVISALTDRHALLVLDNCEHVRDGVAPFLEKLLARCPELSVLATSRARLMVPFERVHQVGPLSLPDAVDLFEERAAAVGWPLDPGQHDRVTEICADLDEVALAIELAAARLPALGLDGLLSVLPDRLRLLTGGARADDRHRSVRTMLDWSHALLDPADAVLLRRVAVFVSPFTAAAATRIAARADVVEGLARLTEQSLLAALPAADGTRYRMLEIIRQYGVSQLAENDELAGAWAQHLMWCSALAAALVAEIGSPSWRAQFDAAADELRAALGRTPTYSLAMSLGELSFARNLLGESQQRFEQAAALEGDPVAALRSAAAVAGCRLRGDDMYRLHRAAAEASGQARDLANAATSAFRFSGVFEQVPPSAETAALLGAAGKLVAADPVDVAAVALAEAGVAADAFGANQGPSSNAVSTTLAAAERAVGLARLTGDPLVVSPSLDALAGAQSWGGDSFGAAATARSRVEMLAPLPVTPESTHELTDALISGVDTALGVGDLPTARRWARQLAAMPMLAEVGHHATAWLIVTDALARDVDDVLAARFLEAWERAGRVRAPRLAAAAHAIAMIHGLQDEPGERAAWLAVADGLGSTPTRAAGYGAVFDAIVELHHGRPASAWEHVAAPPEDVWKWVTWSWLHWYVALRAEAAVLSGRSDAAGLIVAARHVVAGNPIADAQVERAAALLTGDADRIRATAAAFEAAGCSYQAARTGVLNGMSLRKPGSSTGR